MRTAQVFPKISSPPLRRSSAKRRGQGWCLRTEAMPFHLQHSFNLGNNSFWILIDLLISKPQDTVSLSSQPAISSCIIEFPLIMNLSIQFDDEFFFKAHKVDNGSTNLVLSTELVA